jgi:hypothetical protein
MLYVCCLNLLQEKGALSPPQLDALACCDQDALSREKQRANALYKVRRPAPGFLQVPQDA